MQFEHATYICTLITGREVPAFPAELVDKIREMFAQIQEPWEKTKPPDRSNFLNYKHVLHKMMELLGEDEYKMRFGMLKAPAKRYEQDQMWKKICDELRWEFHPSV